MCQFLASTCRCKLSTWFETFCNCQTFIFGSSASMFAIWQLVPWQFAKPQQLFHPHLTQNHNYLPRFLRPHNDGVFGSNNKPIPSLTKYLLWQVQQGPFGTFSHVVVKMACHYVPCHQHSRYDKKKLQFFESLVMFHLLIFLLIMMISFNMLFPNQLSTIFPPLEMSYFSPFESKITIISFSPRKKNLNISFVSSRLFLVSSHCSSM